MPDATVAPELPAWLDVGAMVIAAAFGAHVARLRRIVLFGVLLEGVVVGLGGGIVRDVLLGLEPVAITTWYYIPAVLIAALVGGAVARLGTMSQLPLVVAQAFAIGLLIGIGVQKAVVYDTPVPGAILLGVITGSLGGAIADVLAGRQAAMLRERHWLLSAIVIGAVVFWLFTVYVAFYAAVVMTVVIVVGLRVVSVRLDWTDPSFPGPMRRPKMLRRQRGRARKADSVWTCRWSHARTRRPSPCERRCWGCARRLPTSRRTVVRAPSQHTAQAGIVVEEVGGGPPPETIPECNGALMTPLAKWIKLY